MSTVLTKPVLLDETGQAIVGKLTDIQQAIGGTGEFIPINIRVTTPPTKTNYLAGETLDLSGMVVTLVANNGGMYDVTGDCVFSPADGSTVTSSTTEVSISYTWYKDSTVFTTKQPLSIKELASIAVTTPPTVTEYTVGDTLDLTGIVVTATFADGSTENVTEQCVYSPADGDVLTANDRFINISYTLGAVTKTTTQAINVIAIYGVAWDGTATTAWTRTDAAANFEDPNPYYSGMATTPGSPFDNIMPWSGMVIEERTGGTMVKIPKFWYKLTQNGNGLKIQIANTPVSGFHVSPAHMARTSTDNERDNIYIGRYYCTGSNYKSTTNVTPTNNVRLSTMLTTIHGLGDNIYLVDFATIFTIWLLYLVEFADWNSQAKIGYGCGDGSNITSVGYTDLMPYHTGTMQSSRETYGYGTQYRNIEGLWDNLRTWIDGAYTYTDGSTNPYYMLSLEHNLSESAPSVTTNIEIGTRYVLQGWPNKFTVFNEPTLFPLFLPTDRASSGDGSTYSCDMVYMSSGESSARKFMSFSSYNNDQDGGLFGFRSENVIHYAKYTGCRLIETP